MICLKSINSAAIVMSQLFQCVVNVREKIYKRIQCNSFFVVYKGEGAFNTVRGSKMEDNEIVRLYKMLLVQDVLWETSPGGKRLLIAEVRLVPNMNTSECWILKR